MNVQIGQSWKSAVARSASWRQRQELFREQADRKRRQDKADDRMDDAFEALSTAVLASVAEIDAFEDRLDDYDTAVVEALEDNRLELQNSDERLEEMLANAYVLEDGRRVFKTGDGVRVFDEFGNEVDPSTVSPEEIADFHTKWEPFKAELDINRELQAERADLLEYQDRLDEARSELENGDLTTDDLDALEDGLLSGMPSAVREHMPGQAELDAPDLKSSFSEAAPRPPLAPEPAPAVGQLAL